MSRPRRKRPLSRLTSSGALVHVRTNYRRSCASRACCRAMPIASAASVPGRTRSHTSASRASAVGRGSATISRAPLRRASADGIGLCEPCVGGVRAPEKNDFGVAVVRSRHSAAEREHVRHVLVPVADFGRVTDVRATVGPDEALDPVDAVAHRRAARRRHAKSDGFRAMLAAQSFELRGDLIERPVPADAHPSRIGGAFRRGATHWIKHAVRAMHEFGRRLALEAHRVAGRMFTVGAYWIEYSFFANQRRAHGSRFAFPQSSASRFWRSTFCLHTQLERRRLSPAFSRA